MSPTGSAFRRATIRFPAANRHPAALARRAAVLVATALSILALPALAGSASAAGPGPGPDPGPAPDPDPDPGLTLTIAHVGDHHGRLHPSSVPLELAGLLVETELGGFPRIVATLDDVRARGAEDGEPVVTVHTGGVLEGSAFSAVFGGAADAALMHQACFDLFAPSPGDDLEPEVTTLLDYLADGPCPPTVLAAGTVVVREVDGTEVAFVAADTVEATQARIDDLGARGIRHVVLVSGLGLAGDRELVAGLQGVDAVIGGGSHTLLGHSDDVGLDPAGPYPTTAVDAAGQPVCLAHAWRHARAVGVLQIDFDGDGGVRSCTGQVRLPVGERLRVIEPTGERRPLTGEERRLVDRAVDAHPDLVRVAPDTAARSSLEDWSQALELVIDEPVGTVTEPLCLTGIPSRTVGVLCGNGDVVSDTTEPRADTQRLVADAMRHRAERDGVRTVALLDSRAVRSAVDAGSLSTVQVYRLLPERRTLTLLDLSGAELITALEQAMAAAVDEPADRGAWPHTAGLWWKPRLDRPPGQRVGTALVLSADGAAWEPVDPAERYRVVTTDALAVGATAPDVLREAATGGRATPTGIGLAEALIEYVEAGLDGVVAPPDLGPPTTDPT